MLIKLLFYNLKSFIKNKFGIFILLLIGLTVSAFCLEFFWFKTVSDYQENLRDYSYCNVEIEFKKPSTKAFDIIDRVIEKDKNVCVYLTDATIENRSDDEMIYNTGPIGIVGIYAINPNDTLALGSGTGFTKENMKDDSVLITDGVVVDYKTGEITVNGRTYTSVGVARAAWGNSIIMLYDKFKEVEIAPMGIQFSYDSYDAQTIEYIKTEFSSAFKKAKIYVDVREPLPFYEYFTSDMVVGLVIALFALISVMTLYKYWIILNTYTYSVYKLCGIKNSILKLLIILEVLVYTTLAYAIGTGLYLYVKKQSIISFYNTESILEYIILYLLLVLATFVFVMPLLRKISKQSPIEDVRS